MQPQGLLARGAFMTVHVVSHMRLKLGVPQLCSCETHERDLRPPGGPLVFPVQAKVASIHGGLGILTGGCMSQCTRETSRPSPTAVPPES